MNNFEKLNLSKETEIDRLVTKSIFQIELETKARTKITGPLGSFDIYRASYQDIPITIYESEDDDRIGGSQDEEALICDVMRLSGIGLAGTVAAAMKRAGQIGLSVGKIGLKAGMIGVAAGSLALTGTGKALNSLAKAAIRQSIRLNPDLEDRVSQTVKESSTENTAAKHMKRSIPIRLNQYEEVLFVDKEAAVSVAGPLATIFIAHIKDSRDRLAFIIIAEEDMQVRRTAKEAVAVAIHLSGLSAKSQIEEAGRQVVTLGLGIVGKGTEILAKGLIAAAGAALKMGAMLVK